MISTLAALIRACLRQWLVVALLSAALMLGIAHAFETFGGMAPCHLCLEQRTVYWAAMAIAAVGIALRFTPLGRRADRVFAGALTVTFLVGMGIAIQHAGGEWGFWKLPATCLAGNTSAAGIEADIQAMLSGAKMKVPSCDKPAWVFLGLSMAGWNALASLKLAAYSAAAALGWEPKGG